MPKGKPGCSIRCEACGKSAQKARRTCWRCGLKLCPICLGEHAWGVANGLHFESNNPDKGFYSQAAIKARQAVQAKKE